MTLAFQVEWLDAPGVTDEVDSRTWGRLQIDAADASNTVTLTRLLDRTTGSSRDGVYGAWFPLARWLVDNYWHLLHESFRASGGRSGRALARIPGLRPWVARHSLLAAREGGSLPDVLIVRDGPDVWISLQPDPPSVGRPVRFVENATIRVGLEAARVGVRSFVESVLERLRPVRHSDVARLKQDWEAVLQSETDEAETCAWTARMGLDPYDAEEVTDELVEFLDDHLKSLADELRMDLLDAVDGFLGDAGLGSTSNWVERNVSQLRAVPGIEPCSRSQDPAHVTGYRAADEALKGLGIPADQIEPGTLLQAVKKQYRFPLDRRKSPEGAMPPNVIAAVGANSTDVPLLIGRDLGQSANHFRWARALYLWRFGHLRDTPRLLTRSHDRVQRESRAFAAEFLAPAAALRSRLNSDVLEQAELQALADQFLVTPACIRHQIENHDLAIISDEA